MMLIILQRPPTIASAEGLLIGPLSSLPLNSFTNRRRTYPRTKQGLATFSNCSSITIHPGHGVVQLKVADVVSNIPSCSSQVEEHREEQLDWGTLLGPALSWGR